MAIRRLERMLVVNVRFQVTTQLTSGMNDNFIRNNCTAQGVVEDLLLHTLVLGEDIERERMVAIVGREA